MVAVVAAALELEPAAARIQSEGWKVKETRSHAERGPVAGGAEEAPRPHAAEQGPPCMEARRRRRGPTHDERPHRPRRGSGRRASPARGHAEERGAAWWGRRRSRRGEPRRSCCRARPRAPCPSTLRGCSTRRKAPAPMRQRRRGRGLRKRRRAGREPPWRGRELGFRRECSPFSLVGGGEERGLGNGAINSGEEGGRRVAVGPS